MDIFKPRKELATTEKADAARDARDWPKARDAYERFLEAHSQRHDIWVQLGHARKEMGDLVGAEQAYRQSIALNDAIADTHLQLGHVLKLLKRQDDAIDAYVRASELDSKMTSARRELRALGVDHLPAAPDKARVLIDLSDVFFYLRHHSTVSGIQRVQLGLAKALINYDSGGADVTFLTEMADHSGYAEVDQNLLSILIRTLGRPTVDLKELQKIAIQAATEGLPYMPVKNDLLLILGAFWVLPNVIEQAIALKNRGVRIGVMIHDLIPITHPEFCEKDLTDTFNLYIRSVLKMADLIVSISEHTHGEVRKILQKEKIHFPAMFVLKNAHTSWEPRRLPSAARPSREVASLIQTKYVLYVSTIEIRKNHILLFQVWKQLIREFGDQVPQLVFVGRPGWRVRDLMDQIVGTDYLNDRISILHDVPDVDLELLYRNAMFTTFPSFEEGWGLPVGESLTFGRPCVASTTSSIPEVGGDFVDYIDPLDVNDAVSVFRKMIRDQQYLADRCKNIADNFKARTWRDVAAELLIEVNKFFDQAKPAVELDASSMVPVLAPGKIHFIGHKDERSDYVNLGLGADVHFLFDENWYPVENFGRWMAGGRGSLKFAVPQASRGPIRLMITLSIAEWCKDIPIQIFVNEKPLKPFAAKGNVKPTVLVDADASSGEVEIGFSIKGEIPAGPDVRKDLCWGIVSLGYAGEQDLSARISLIEETLGWQPVMTSSG